MIIYNEKFKLRENIFSVNSRLFVAGGKLMVSIVPNQNSVLPEGYEIEIENNFKNCFGCEAVQIIMPFDEFCEKYSNNDNFSQIIYWLALAITTYHICPNKRIDGEFKIAKLKYKKASLFNILKQISQVTLARLLSEVYSAIVDAMCLVEKYCKQFDNKRFCYLAVLIAKEYLDDVTMYAQGKVNVGYPRENKKLKIEQYFDKVNFTILRAKQFEI